MSSFVYLFTHVFFSLVFFFYRVTASQHRARYCLWRFTSAAWLPSPGGHVWLWPGSSPPASSGVTKRSRTGPICSIWWRGPSPRCRRFSCSHSARWKVSVCLLLFLLLLLYITMCFYIHVSPSHFPPFPGRVLLISALNYGLWWIWVSIIAPVKLPCQSRFMEVCHDTP